MRSSALATVAKLRVRALRSAPATRMRNDLEVFLWISLKQSIKTLGLRVDGREAVPIRCLTHTVPFRVPNPTCDPRIA